MERVVGYTRERGPWHSAGDGHNLLPATAEPGDWRSHPPGQLLDLLRVEGRIQDNSESLSKREGGESWVGWESRRMKERLKLG